jgi:release factor glutamine methyltransferase
MSCRETVGTKIEMLSVLEIIQKTSEFLGAKGVESPRLNAELLMGHALGLKRMQLYLQFERLLTEAELEKIRPLVRRRALREPLQYIVGSADFHGLKLKVDRRALIPRPETELLVEIVIGLCTVVPARVLDLGTGSGAIALALAAAFPTAELTAVDTSNDALALAAENAGSTAMEGRVRWLRSSWFEALDPAVPFDVIVGNPPYLSAAELAEVAPEVGAHEPVAALTAGENGVSDLRIIISQAASYLRPDGLLALETGIAHHAELVRLAQASGFARVESRQDLTKRDRFVLAWKA